MSDRKIKQAKENGRMSRRSKVDEALREIERRNREIIDNSLAGYFYINHEGLFQNVNPAWLKMHKYANSSEVLGKHFSITQDAQDLVAAQKIVDEVLNGHQLPVGEFSRRCKDGSIGYHTYSCNKVLKDGKIVGLEGFLIDNTERIRAEKALRESETKFKTIADFTYDWEYWLSDDDRFIYITPSCERITGFTQDDFISNPQLLRQIILKDDLELFDNHHSDVTENQCSGEVDLRITTREGNIRWINHICQPIFDENGIYMGKRGSNRDITERIKTGDQVKELNRKLSELNADKDRFISILAHDLKSPFNNILGLSELLTGNIQNFKTNEIVDIADNIYKSSHLAYNLLEDILMWARTQSGKIPFNPQNLNLNEILSNITGILDPVAHAKNLIIKNYVPSGKSVYADSDMLKTILRNLVSNSIKFTKPGGTISLHLEENSDKDIISVSDNGLGISPENLSKLFDISQVISTKGTGKETGTGLGLLLCKEFVERHGGRIWVESEEGIGSNFKFTLPNYIVRKS